MAPKVAQHPWSSDVLFSRALVYIGEMERHTVGDWQYGLWSSLALELIARSALAQISPALLAARNDWRHVSYSLGYPPTKKGFSPKSATATEVLSILNELVPEFNGELRDFCEIHCARRNAALHSGEDTFSGLGTSTWLPKFYSSCDVFLRFLGKNLEHFFADPAAAKEMIDALRDTAAKAVAQEIDAKKKDLDGKGPEDQKIAAEQAVVWATRHAGHRIICPACKNTALVRGSGQRSVTTVIDEEAKTRLFRNRLPSVLFRVRRMWPKDIRII